MARAGAVTDRPRSALCQRGGTRAGPLVTRYLAESGARPDVACFGIACPVIDGDCEAPNLPWKVNARVLAREIGIPRTTIINDFGAVGYGLHSLSDDEVEVLQQGVAADRGPIALIGAGTGLGQVYLLWDGSRYVVHPSEGGHADFSPTNALERDLLAFLAKEFGRVSSERVLSGAGIAHIYRFSSRRRRGGGAGGRSRRDGRERPRPR